MKVSKFERLPQYKDVEVMQIFVTDDHCERFLTTVRGGPKKDQTCYGCGSIGLRRFIGEHYYPYEDILIPMWDLESLSDQPASIQEAMTSQVKESIDAAWSWHHESSGEKPKYCYVFTHALNTSLNGIAITQCTYDSLVFFRYLELESCES